MYRVEYSFADCFGNDVEWLVAIEQYFCEDSFEAIRYALGRLEFIGLNPVLFRAIPYADDGLDVDSAFYCTADYIRDYFAA